MEASLRGSLSALLKSLQTIYSVFDRSSTKELKVNETNSAFILLLLNELIKNLSTTRIPTKETAVISGTIAEGAKSVMIITDSAFTGSILGDTANASSFYPFVSESGLGAIPYVITAGSIEILKLS